jgi:hypothetical protein
VVAYRIVFTRIGLQERPPDLEAHVNKPRDLAGVIRRHVEPKLDAMTVVVVADPGVGAGYIRADGMPAGTFTIHGEARPA